MPFKLFFVSLLVCVVSFFQPAFAGGHGEANAFGFALVVPAEEVERVEKLLDKEGGSLFLIGGNVRDLILKKRITIMKTNCCHGYFV